MGYQSIERRDELYRQRDREISLAVAVISVSLFIGAILASYTAIKSLVLLFVLPTVYFVCKDVKTVRKLRADFELDEYIDKLTEQLQEQDKELESLKIQNATKIEIDPEDIKNNWRFDANGLPIRNCDFLASATINHESRYGNEYEDLKHKQEDITSHTSTLACNLAFPAHSEAVTC